MAREKQHENDVIQTMQQAIEIKPAMTTGMCPVCDEPWRYSAKFIREHLRMQHPVEYQAYLDEKKDELKLKSISATEERLVALLKEGPQTRDQLVKKLRIPRTTIYDGLRKLIRRNEVKKFPLFATERSRGRPQVLFSLLDGK